MVLVALTRAAAPVAGAPHVLTDDTERVVLGTDLQVLEDPDGVLQLAEIVAPAADDRFRKISAPVPNFGFTSTVIWVRTAVTAHHRGEREWRLHLPYPLLDRVDFYIEQPGGSFDHYHLGDSLPFAARPIQHADFVLPLRTTSGTTARIYVRVETESAVHVPLLLWTPDALARRDRVANLWMGMFYGITLVMILYNLLLSFMVRDRSYLYFCGFALAFLTVQAGMDGYLYEYLLGAWPALNGISIPLGAALTTAFGMQFARHFMDLRTLPRLNWIAIVVVGVSTALALLSFVASYRLSVRLAAGFALLSCPLLLYVGVSALRSGITVARFFVLAWLFFLLGSVMLILCRFGVLPLNIFTENGPKIGFIANVILLSLALGDRINAVKAEKDLAQRKALEERARAAATLEAEVKRQTRELRQQAERLREADVQKTRFIQNVSHELRTPLTLILMPLEQLSERPELAGDPNVEVAQRNTRRLLRLVNELLDFHKLSAGRRELRLQPVRLSGFIDRCAEYVRVTCEQTEISLTVAAPGPDAELVALVEPDALEKIVFNYLSNALRFTPAGGRIELALSREGERARISVQDTGPGISAEELGRLFEPFSQVDDGGAARGHGTGLGLALVKQLALALGGEVGVDSEPGRGSEFWVALPLAEAADAVEGEPIKPGHLGELRAPAGQVGTDPADEQITGPADAPLILIAEDQPEMRALIRTLVAASGYRTVTVGDGERALDLAHRLRPDVIVSDWMMPRMTGPELVRTIRADPELAPTPIVMLTAKSDDQSRIFGAEIGADAFVGKPFDARELSCTVRNLVALKAGERHIERMAEHLREERDALAQTQQAKDDLARFIVHDLKNPLTIISGNLEFLMDSAKLTEDDQASVASSFVATESLMRMVMDLLDVSRAEDGELGARPTSLPAGALFEEVGERMRRWLLRSGHELVVEPSVATVRADRALLVRVLENLIDNAAKYSPPGPIVMDLVSNSSDDVVRIADRGRPIADEQRERIFEKYHRLADSGHEPTDRTSRGLGLVFCRLAARAHGGEVWVESSENGNMFCVRLPRTGPEESGQSTS
ncbi:MAG TPA: ATP-binding protein [Kofleriaceae bacterium]|nr:ATP-binding protein [Kofleriaceae bacterium]